jgi:hypothetical protein
VTGANSSAKNTILAGTLNEWSGRLVPELAQIIDEIELLLPGDVEAAKRTLRKFLLQQSNSEEKGSIGDALLRLAKAPTERRELAAAIIRFLAAPDLIPEPNANNQIARSIVEIATGSLSDLSTFLGITTGAQTFQNFAILKGAHERICSLLAPLKREQSSLEVFLTATKIRANLSMHLGRR